MPADAERHQQGADLFKTKQETASRPVFWLVPAGEDGRPEQTKAIPIMEASSLNEVFAPVMPMYELRTAAQLLCMTYKGLANHLLKHRALYPSRYRRVPLKNGPAYVRVLSAKEVNEIQQRITRVKKSRKSSIVRAEQAQALALAEAAQ